VIVMEMFLQSNALFGHWWKHEYTRIGLVVLQVPLDNLSDIET